jgi:hypothetical protein
MSSEQFKKMEKLQEEITKLTDKNVLESSNDILASTYVQMYAIVDDLKKSMDFLKKEILKREISDKMVPELKRKVVISEGNSSTEVDVKAVYQKALDVEDGESLFWNSVSISKSALEFTVLDSIVKEFSRIIPSESKIVKVLKMTKEELKEAEIKK